MKIKKWVVFALITVLVVGAMAAITYRTFAQGTDHDDASESQDNSVVLQGQAGITQEQAEAIALALHPDAKVSATELEREGGSLVFSIELDNGSEVEVDAASGTVLPEAAEEGTESDG